MRRAAVIVTNGRRARWLVTPAGIRFCRMSLARSNALSDFRPNLARTRKLAAGLRTAGVRMIDAPVSGGIEGARSGTLSITAGGDEGDLAAWLPMLSQFGHSIVHVGGIGAGHATKALNNLLSATALLITGEAMLVAKRFGVDPSVLLTAINGSSGRNSATERKFPAFVLPGTFSSGFSAKLMGKDIGIALSLAHQTGTPAPLAEQVLGYWTELCERIEPNADHTEVVRPQATDATVVLWPTQADEGAGRQSVTG